MDEERYTLEEAQQKINEIECSTHGHDLDIVMTMMSDDPIGAICGSCGKRWRMSGA